jgi:hypothetical protein
MALKQMEPKKVKVGEYHFYIRPFPAFKASNLTGELASVLSPLVGAVAPLAGIGNIMDMDVEKIAEKLSQCTFGGIDIDGDKLEEVMKKLLLGGHIVVEYEDDEGEQQQEVLDKDLANEVFCGNVQDMFVLCVHVINLNYKGFFGKLAALSGKAEQEAAKTQRKIL